MGLAFRHKYNRYKGIPIIQHGDGYKGYHPKKDKNGGNGQRGRGFGSFFKNLAKKAAPHLKDFATSTMKDLAPLAANTAIGMMTAEKGTRKDLAKASLKQALALSKSNAARTGKAAMGITAFPAKGGRVQKKSKKRKKKKRKAQEGSGRKTFIGQPNIFFPNGTY